MLVRILLLAFLLWPLPALDARGADAISLSWTARFPEGIYYLTTTHSGLVIAATGQEIIGLWDKTGKIAWRQAASSRAIHILSAQGKVVIAFENGGIVGLNERTGKINWFVRGGLQPKKLFINDGRLFLHRRDGTLQVVSLKTGKLRWKRPAGEFTGPCLTAGTSQVYRADNNFIYAHPNTWGQALWKFAIPTCQYLHSASNQLLLYSQKSGYFTALDPATGRFQWDLKPANPPIDRPRLYSDLYLLTTSDKTGILKNKSAPYLLKGIEKATGKILWYLESSRKTIPAASSQGYLALAAQKGILLILSPKDGQSVAYKQPGAQIKLLAATATHLLAALADGRLLSLKIDPNQLAKTTLLDKSMDATGRKHMKARQLERIARLFISREIESVRGKPLPLDKILVGARRSLTDPDTRRLVVDLKLLIEGRDPARIKIAADSGEIMAFMFEKARLGAAQVELSRSQAIALCSKKVLIPQRAIPIQFTAREDKKGRNYLSATWTDILDKKLQIILKLNPRTGGLIYFTSNYPAPKDEQSKWLANLLKYDPLQQFIHPEAGVNRRLFTGRIRHFKRASRIFGVAYDGHHMWVPTNGGVYRLNLKTRLAQRYTTRDGLLDNRVTTAYVGLGRATWFGSQRGLTRFSNEQWHRFPFLEVDIDLANLEVRAICQGPRFLYLATNQGVLAFNGSEWIHYGKSRGLLSVNIRALAFDRKRRHLWLTSDKGVMRFDGIDWRLFRKSNGLSTEDTYAIIIDRSGHVWVSSEDNGVMEFDGKAWKIHHKVTGYGIPDDQGPASNNITNFALDTPGGVWGIHASGLTRHFKGKWRHFPVIGPLRSKKIDQVILAGRRMYAVAGGDHPRLASFDGLNWRKGWKLPERQEPPSGEWIVSEGNNLWIGTINYGISRYDGKNWTRYNIRKGKSIGSLRSTYSAVVDDKGQLWVGGDGELCRYSASKWACFTKGGKSFHITKLARDAKGELWMGTWGDGIWRYNGQRWMAHGRSEGLPSLYIKTLLFDKSGNLWILSGNRKKSEKGGISILRPDAQYFFTFGPAQGLLEAWYSSLAIDRSHKIWCTTGGGSFYRFDGRASWHRDRRYGGLPPAPLKGLHFDDRNNPWVIYDLNRGVRHFNGKRWRAFTRNNGLISNSVKAIYQDKKGTIWYVTEAGITALSR